MCKLCNECERRSSTALFSLNSSCTPNRSHIVPISLFLFNGGSTTKIFSCALDTPVQRPAKLSIRAYLFVLFVRPGDIDGGTYGCPIFDHTMALSNQNGGPDPPLTSYGSWLEGRGTEGNLKERKLLAKMHDFLPFPTNFRYTDFLGFLIFIDFFCDKITGN
jgi:hypothetical protein